MKAPERIYLQTGLDEWDSEDAAWESLEGVTWCSDRIDDSDVEYVRRDVAAALRTLLIEAWQQLRPGIESRLLIETAWLAEPPEEAKP